MIIIIIYVYCIIHYIITIMSFDYIIIIIHCNHHYIINSKFTNTEFAECIMVSSRFEVKLVQNIKITS